MYSTGGGGEPGGCACSCEICAPLLVSPFVLLYFSVCKGSSHFRTAVMHAKELLALFTLTGFL